MEQYSITQVETLTGIQAHTLRVWEKRYNLIQPLRTATKIRYYTSEHLKKLLNISSLVHAGYKISKVAKMSESEIHRILLEDLPRSNSNFDDVNSLVISMLELDELRFEKTFKISVIRIGFQQTITKLIYPFLRQVGVLWGINQALPAHEHYISNMIRQKIFTAIEGLDVPKINKKVILFLPENEEHEIGLLFTYYLFKQAGWTTYYLGVNVPLENIQKMEKLIRPDYLCCFFITPSRNTPQERVSQLLLPLKSNLLLAGNDSLLPEGNGIQYKCLRSPEELLDILN